MKKRILSLILALSMVLSVLPLGAFAADPNQDLVMDGGFPVGTSGSDWSYDDITKTLTLTSGTYDFSNTNPKTKTGKPTNQAVRCKIEIQSRAEITGGIFTGGSAGEVKNYGTISGGTFQNTCSVTNGGTITGNGIFNGGVTNNSTISGGTFQNGCSVTNNNTISGGTFQNGCSVINNSNISDGTFEGTVTNEADGKINGGTFAADKTVTNKGIIDSNGTFNGEVTNEGTIKKGTFAGEVTNLNTIEDGTFNGKVSNNQGGNITNGTFEQEVINNDGGGISGGTFKGTVSNGNGIITGGTFAAGLSRNDGSVTGGVFNGDTGLTDAHHVTVTNGSLSQVNGVDPRNADGTTGTAWDLYSYKDTTVTITASTDIYSLNDQPIVDGNCKSSYDGSNKTIVKFTMPNRNVELGTGGLVMAGGYPVGTSGKGWSYDNSTETLTLTSGEYDFSSTEPVKCKILLDSKSATITGGTFEKLVVNDGYIEKGTFNGTVENSHGKIYNGTFNGKVTNNDGTILGGIFAGSVENKGWIYGGVFNGKTGLDGVKVLISITVASGAKITEVNGVSAGESADWKPYVVVTSQATTNEVIITADTEIFSLNGYPIDGSPYSSSYPDTTDKKTVKFTELGVLDNEVVLNGAITHGGDLVMENGYPKVSNGGTIPCSGTGWSYDSSTKTLTLTDGTFDFNSTHPQGKTPGTSTTTPVACAIQ